MRFFSTLIASTLGTLIALGLMFFIGLAFLFALAAADDPEPTVRSGSVLKLPLSGPLYEQEPDQPLAGAFGDPGLMTVREVTQALKKAAADDRISAVWLQPQGLFTDWAQLETVRRALHTFKDSDKPLLATAGPNGFSERDYFLATAADEIYAPPEAGFEFDGFYIAVQFYAQMLDKLDITPEVIRAGKFKSAVEPFLRTDLSEENRAQLQALLDTQEASFFAAVAESRGVTPATLDEWTDANGVFMAEEAQKAGLIDDLMFQDEVLDKLKALTELDTDASLPIVDLEDYVHVPTSSAGLPSGSDGTIAVAYALGEIRTGESTNSEGPLSSSTMVGSTSFTKMIRDLRENETVKAIVLRIDSPGGSATASDVMWREIKLAAEAKPLIVSMGGLAASGGYYIAAPADTIVAEPTTITGSIGAYAMMLNLSQLMENRIGITSDAVQTGPYADMLSGRRPLQANEIAVLERSIDAVYDTFTRKVAEGRNLSQEQVHEIAQGRVWSGEDAVDVGLVDVLGGLDTAIEIAAEKAGLAPDTYRVRSYPSPKTWFEQLSESLQVNASTYWANLWTTPETLALQEHLRTLQALSALQGTVQTRMPFSIVIE